MNVAGAGIPQKLPVQLLIENKRLSTPRKVLEEVVTFEEEMEARSGCDDVEDEPDEVEDEDRP